MMMIAFVFRTLCAHQTKAADIRHTFYGFCVARLTLCCAFFPTSCFSSKTVMRRVNWLAQITRRDDCVLNNNKKKQQKHSK